MTAEEYRELKRLFEEKSSADGERFTQIDQRFTQIDRRFDELRAEIQMTAADTRRHFDVVYEKFRQDLKPLANGVAHHATVLDEHEARLVRLEQARLRFDG